MELIMEDLRNRRHRSSTSENYLAIWRKFNKFIIRLDNKPNSWEERVGLFVAFMANSNRKSTTVRSYISAIKSILKDDGYIWNENKVQLNLLTRGCRLINDRVKLRLPIKTRLLDLMLFETERVYDKQVYLCALYKAMLSLGYYGLLRVGEMTKSPHVIKAANVHVGKNKDKILMVLYSSKTHGKDKLPQKIKITANENARISCFCPFKIANQYLKIRGDYRNMNEQLFVMADRSPVEHIQFRRYLRSILKNLNLNEMLYDCHSLRSGRASEMQNFGYSIQQIKLAGRWSSNAVYKYFK